MTRVEVWPPPLRLVGSDPAAEPALRPLLRAGRLSTFRVSQVVCPAPRGHRLVDVLRSPTGLLAVAGDVVVFLGGLPELPDRDLRRELVDLDSDGVTRVVGMLAWPGFHPEHHGGPALSARCPHREAFVPLSWVAEQVADHRRRSVWRYSARVAQDRMIQQMQRLLADDA